MELKENKEILLKNVMNFEEKYIPRMKSVKIVKENNLGVLILGITESGKYTRIHTFYIDFYDERNCGEIEDLQIEVDFNWICGVFELENSEYVIFDSKTGKILSIEYE